MNKLDKLVDNIISGNLIDSKELVESLLYEKCDSKMKKKKKEIDISTHATDSPGLGNPDGLGSSDSGGNSEGDSVGSSDSGVNEGNGLGLAPNFILKLRRHIKWAHPEISREKNNAHREKLEVKLDSMAKKRFKKL
jgi:hypothetical protein